MSESLSFNEDKLFAFLLREIIDLKTRQYAFERVISKHLDEVVQDHRFEDAFQALCEANRPDIAQELLAKLRAESTGFDDFLKDHLR